MRKIIHSKFEIDLSNLKLTDTQQNSMFTDGFFVKTTFPFDIILTDELEQQFDFISDYNTSVDTIYDVIYVHNGKKEKAKLEIIQIIGVKMSAVLQYGFDDFPSFNKKLSELSLDNFDLPSDTDIYEHANDVVTQTWPDVNYNFPQVHVDKYDTSEGFYTHFEKIINNRKSGLFVKNYFNPENAVSYNRNIIQPLPYALHILKKGFLDGGYILEGNVLTDELLKRATVYGDVDYFKNNDGVVTDTIRIYHNEYFYVEPNSNGSFHCNYEKSIILEKPGVYFISGFNSLQRQPSIGSTEYGYFELNGNIVTNSGNDAYLDIDNNLIAQYYHYITCTVPNSILKINAASNPFLPDTRLILEVEITLVSEFVDGAYLPSLLNENKIDLRKAVPDITFGEYVTFWKNYLNYDITGIEGNTIYMNKVEDKFNSPAVKDLSMHDQKKPVRKFKQGISFLLKFQDIESKEYEYKKVFQNKDNVMYSGYPLDAEKTSTIEINGLPLPLLMRSVKTAHAFEENDNKVYIVPYNGLTGGLNLALPITDFLLENVHPLYWYLWFKFRINSKNFEWNFVSENEVFTNLIVKDVVHSYRNFHFIKSLTKTEIKPGLFEYELETEA
ncbi:hypothetical protein [Flavobacterium facile]|uniref:hypothetical protein n=1 Tax=Flavobacterium facile TaxID=2893174 RepID=UPI002E78EB79|nr:hypothetical protein [Flavobacterium sp. T-12]